MKIVDNQYFYRGPGRRGAGPAVGAGGPGSWEVGGAEA